MAYTGTVPIAGLRRGKVIDERGTAPTPGVERCAVPAASPVTARPSRGESELYLGVEFGDELNTRAN